MSAVVVALRRPRPHVRAHSMFARALITLVRLYQWFLSPFLGGQCRFEPSCSRYATAFTQSIEAAHGVTTGVSAADRVQTIQCALRSTLESPLPLAGSSTVAGRCSASRITLSE